MTVSSHNVESHEEREERVEKKGKTYLCACSLLGLDFVMTGNVCLLLKKIEILLHIYFKVLS